MENDKNELQYVMNILKNSPPKTKESSKEFSSFTINKKWQFNLKPETKFDSLTNNNGFLYNNILNNLKKNEFVPKNEYITDKDKDSPSFNTCFLNRTNQAKNQKSSTLFQNYKPNLNIRKFSNIPKASSLNRDNKWLTNNNYNNNYNLSKNTNYNNSKIKKNQQQQKSVHSKLISKIKIRYLNFRPYIDLPKSHEEEINKNLDLDNCDSLSITCNFNTINTNQTNYYFKLLGNNCLLVKKLLEDNGFIESRRNEEWTIVWSSGHIKLNNYEKLNKYQRMNHFPRSNEMTRKDLLYKNLSKLKELFPGSKFDFLPESYILPNEYTFLKDKMDKNPNQVWIFKPVASSQGRGIFLTKYINEIPNNCAMIASRYINNPFLINNKKFDFLPESYILPNEYTFLKDKMDKNPNQFWIVKPVASSQVRGIFLTKNINEIANTFQMIASRYINNPFLINNKKFDLRIYAFVTSIKPLRIYRFKEGLTRFSTNNYNSDKNDRCAHLTNYAVNKNNKNYIQNKQPFDIDYNSSKWTLTSLKQYLEDQDINSELLFSKIDDIIIKTLMSCENNLLSVIFKYCFFSRKLF